MSTFGLTDAKCVITMKANMKGQISGTRKTEVFQIRMSREFKERIRRTAKNRGISIAEVLRIGVELLEGQPPT